ncbi:MAG: 2-oxoacid:acceptor oxidoreductase family protein [Anaerolineales bacterium]|nr:2-oxoacid:acceptor oxidoreductase family protein [Anaerolineales bacterium]
MRKEIRISGFGGQGVVLVGYILGKALAIYAKYEAVMTQAYGPEARGGASSANIVISDEPIDYPFVLNPDILVALSQEGYNRFRPTIRKNGLILIDDGLVKPIENDDIYGIPATRIAEELGRRVVTNVVMLGFMTALIGLVPRESVEKAIESSIRKKLVPLNLNAFESGYEYAYQNLSHREVQVIKNVITG